jgi:EAL domain-containing protein (putative c-di-GMP-specific phosphodiesterase class I)
MSTDDRNRSIVKAIIAMAHKFSMKTVAQGVETAEQRDLLIAEGDNLAKGYFFAKHIPRINLSCTLARIRPLVEECPKTIIHRVLQVLFTSQVTLCGQNRGVA